MADATKVQGNLLDWTTLDDTASDNPSVVATDKDVGEGSVDVELYIAVAHKDTNAAGANMVTVQVFGKTGANGEDYRSITSFQTGGGTAVKEDIAATSGSGQANPERIEVADTADWDTGLGERLFILDATEINSEIVQIRGWADNDYYIATRALTQSHLNTADLLSGLNEHRVSIPNGIRYVEVVFSNADDDANYSVKIDYSAVSEYV